MNVSLIAESWVAVLGLTSFIDGEDVNPDKPASSQVIGLEDEIKRIVTAFFLGRPLSTSRQRLRFDALAEALLQNPDIDSLATVGQWPDTVGAAMVVVISSGRSFLLSKMPRSFRSTPWGKEPQRPGQNVIDDFTEIWAVVESPLIALRTITTASFGKTEVEAFRTVYPSMYQKVVEIVIDTIAAFKAVDRDIDLDPRQEKQLATLLGTAEVDTRVAAAIRSLYGDPDAEEMKPRQSSIKTGLTPTAGQAASGSR